MEINFEQSEIVKIENEDQFNKVKHVLRNSNEEGSTIKYPIYLEHCKNGTIGYTHNTFNTWNKKEYEILQFEDIN